MLCPQISSDLVFRYVAEHHRNSSKILGSARRRSVKKSFVLLTSERILVNFLRHHNICSEPLPNNTLKIFQIEISEGFSASI